MLVAGVLLATLGCAMMIPALYDLTIGHEDWLIFAASATITLFVGIGLAFANQTTLVLNPRKGLSDGRPNTHR